MRVSIKVKTGINSEYKATIYNMQNIFANVVAITKYRYIENEFLFDFEKLGILEKIDLSTSARVIP